MKIFKTLYFIFFALALLPSWAFGQNKLNQFDDAGKQNGLWIETFQNGDIKSVADYSSGKKDGLFLSFAPNGEIVSDSIFNKGELVPELCCILKPNKADKPFFDATGKLYSGPYFYQDLTSKGDFTVLDSGYAHGIASFYVTLLNVGWTVISYKGEMVYVLLSVNNEDVPSRYYTYWGSDRIYTIDYCEVRGDLLRIGFSNQTDYSLTIPSLRARTLAYLPTTQWFHHELTYVVRDTLFVNLNHFHPEGRYFTEGINGEIKYLAKRRLNYFGQQFNEILLPPKTSIEQKVKIHTFNTYIGHIVLIIENQRYIFENIRAVQSPVQVVPIKETDVVPHSYYYHYPENKP